MYTCKNAYGPDWAAQGDWIVSGPNIEPLHFADRTMAKVVERALNLAYVAGENKLTERHSYTCPGCGFIIDKNKECPHCGKDDITERA